MGDWTYALIIVICTFIWIHQLVDYRKKLALMAPGIDSVSSRKSDYSEQISQSETNTQDIQQSIGSMRKEIEELEEKRVGLQEELNRKEMILVAGGTFEMGSATSGHIDEEPEHKVTITQFYLDRFEVTNLQYKDFVDATDHRVPVHWRNRTFPEARRASHPVVNVSWEDAKAYADWMGKRLPTEGEWEWAARGDQSFDYPWGRTCNPDCANYDNPDGKTSDVDKFPRGQAASGAWDMCGNVGEWVNDWYDDEYYQSSTDLDPQGPPGGNRKVYRGGGFQGNRMDIRTVARHFAMSATSQEYIGFRCAMSYDIE